MNFLEFEKHQDKLKEKEKQFRIRFNSCKWKVYYLIFTDGTDLEFISYKQNGHEAYLEYCTKLGIVPKKAEVGFEAFINPYIIEKEHR